MMLRTASASYSRMASGISSQPAMYGETRLPTSFSGPHTHPLDDLSSTHLSCSITASASTSSGLNETRPEPSSSSMRHPIALSFRGMSIACIMLENFRSCGRSDQSGYSNGSPGCSMRRFLL